MRAIPLTYHSYLQFSLSGLTGTVSSAKLPLFVTDSSPDVGSVFDVSNSWSELTINWNNAPQPASPTPIGRGGLAMAGDPATGKRIQPRQWDLLF